MRNFEFLEPSSVAEASRMLADLGDECRVIAGGTALLLAMRQRMLAPSRLISLSQLEVLRGIRFDAGHGLTIGALSRHADIAQSALVQQHAPMLAAMAAQVANPQVRNQGTIGGNLCYADPSTDPPGCLLALDARVQLSGLGGVRELPMQEFLLDYFTTALQPDELLTAIRIPTAAPDSAGLYTRHLRTAAEHRPVANVSLWVRRSGAQCLEARLAVGAAVAVAQRLPRAEGLLTGQTVTADLAAAVADAVAAEIEPISDVRGSGDYRRDMVRVATRRTVERLFGLTSAT